MNKNTVEIRRLEIAKEEYERQITDFSILEQRSSFIMILYVAIITLLIPCFQTLYNVALFGLILSLLIVASLLLIVGFVFLILVNYSTSIKK